MKLGTQKTMSLPVSMALFMTDSGEGMTTGTCDLKTVKIKPLKALLFGQSKRGLTEHLLSTYRPSNLHDAHAVIHRHRVTG